MFLGLLLLCVLLMLFMNQMMEHHYFKYRNPPDQFGLIIDTPGCKIPKLDPYDPSVIKLIKEKRLFKCKGDPEFMYVANDENVVILNETILSTSYNMSSQNIKCFYSPIFRVQENKNSTREKSFAFGNLTALRFGVPIEEEFLKVNCKLGSKEYTQFIPLVPLKPEVEKRASKAKINITDPLNVILIGIDSVSKLNFLRHFKKTHKFLVSNMSTFDMKGYTKVGDNTFPNLVPMLTGHFVEHYWSERVKDKMVFDNLDFIWKAYSEAGYRTFYAEDSPKSGTFNYLKRGFLKPPTDYYYRPMGLAIDKSVLKKRSKYCLNNRLEFDFILGYLRHFIRVMKDRPYFAFAILGSLTHDHLNDAGYADEPTYNLLKDLWIRGVMNKSMVFVFSDHGIRFGEIRETYIGKLEERMPFMYLSLPKWFLQKHPDLFRNLNENQKRLTSPFDIHATLHHLLNFVKVMPENQNFAASPNGLSLFRDISKYRTCEMANILPHWCPCQVYDDLPTTDETVERIAFAIIHNINSQLKPLGNVCARLEVDEITDARIGKANDMVQRYVKTENIVLNRYVVLGEKVNPLSDYLVTVRAKPGGGLFEGTVRLDIKTNFLRVLGISRINMYGKQSICIDRPILRKFCFCI